MYLPKTPPKKHVNHFSFARSRRHLYGGAILSVMIVASATVYALGKVRGRARQSQLELARTHPGRRVVIVGAGVGGCALAGNLCNADPELHLTVVDASRRQTFHGVVPLAHVGHRSYDLNTTGAVDFLSSPLSWNVTRRANMVLGEVVRVLPERQEVVVRAFARTEAMLAKDGDHGEARRLWWWRRWTHSAPAPRRNPDGSQTLSDGCVSYPYDVLVVASGAQRSLGPLKNFLDTSDLDSCRIAVSPGVSRDALAHLYKGNVLHIKVPPTSFVSQIERIRQKLLPPAIRVSEADLKAASRVYLEKDHATPLIATHTKKACADENGGNGALAPFLTTNLFLKAWCSCKSSTDAAASPPGSNPDESAPHNFPPYMHYATRQDEGTFVSSTNLIWKYLHYFSKLSFCTLYTIVADGEPIGSAPHSVNKVIREHWSSMQMRSYRTPRLASASTNLENGELSEKALAELRFFFLSHSYPTNFDLNTYEVTLYNYAYNALISLPFALVLLDLPLAAPGFIRASGLHRKDYAQEHRPSSLSTGWWNAVASKRMNPLGDTTAFRWMEKVRRAPSLRDCFRDEEGFMDVYPDTLQHRRYDNIFALGDAAGLPTAKSYGSTLAQVPVVAHNVLQIVRRQKILQRIAETGKEGILATPRGCVKRSATAHTSPGTTGVEGNISEANARYNGYSSFHISMTPWRVMWPEMEYNRRQIDAFRALHDLGSTGSKAKNDQGELPLIENDDPVLLGSQPLKYCNQHIWDNLAWKGLRGGLNGLFYQSGLYEILFFFLFNSGAWYPPGWLAVPTFSPVDGSLEPRGRFSWL